MSSHRKPTRRDRRYKRRRSGHPAPDFATALQRHQQGQWQEAESLYRDILRREPQNDATLHMLGVLLYQQQEYQAAEQQIRQAIALDECSAQYQASLGLVQLCLGQLDAASTSVSRACHLGLKQARAYHKLGIQLLQQNALSWAQRAFELALQIDPRYADAHNNLGNIHKELGQTDSAMCAYRRALEIDPHLAIAHYNLGLMHRSRAELQQAVACYERAIQQQADYANAHFRLGTVCEDLGETQRAQRCYAQVLRIDPRCADAHYRLGEIDRREGNRDQAQTRFASALQLTPEHADSLHGLGHLAQDRNDLQAAAEYFQRAVKSQPQMATSHFQLALVQRSRGQLAEAAASYQRAIAARPDFAEAHNNLGVIQQARGNLGEAIACYQRALRLPSRDVRAYHNLALAYQEMGQTENAIATLKRALTVRQDASMRYTLATVLPIIYGSMKEMRAYRRRLVDAVGRLRENDVKLDPRRDQRVNATFRLAFQGSNDREIQLAIAQLWHHDASASATAPSQGDGRIHVGFLSSCLRKHTIGKLTRGIIARLSREHFHTTVFAIETPNDDVSRWIAGQVESYVPLSRSIELAQQAVLKRHLDVLVYPDIGMDPTVSLLARTRLAEVQCAMWGHPVTTGMPTIDYFLSSELLEIETAQAHYSERLIKLATLPTFYYRPQPPHSGKARQEFGLPEDRNIYLCPQSLFKLHPHFDLLVGEILRRDPQGILVLIDGEQPAWNEILLRRLKRTLPDVVRRVIFVPRQASDDFLNLLSVADVMLDPPHFGGGNTNYEAMAVGVPVVTLPSPLLRGRVACALYRKMEWMECVADSPLQYVQLAVRLATDSDFRQHVRQQIQQRRAVLFEDIQAVRQFEQFLQQAHRAAGEGRLLEDEDRPEAATSRPSQVLVSVDGDPASSRSVAQPQQSAAARSCPEGAVGAAALSDILKQYTCPACGHHVAVPFFDGGRQPLTTLAWPRSRQQAAAMPRLPLNFVRCVDCGHVYNADFDYAQVPYSDKPNLMFNQGAIWSEHLRHVQQLMVRQLPPQATVVEIGCGDGHLLRALAVAHPEGRYIGFDPNSHIDTGQANIEARPTLFHPAIHLAPYRPDLIISRHVLEHLMNPLAFVQALAFAVSWENVPTRLFIEVPCIDRVFARGRTVDFFYEHNSHFTTNSLRRMLLRCASEVELIDTAYNHEVVYGIARFERRAEHLQCAGEALEFYQRARQFAAGLSQQFDRLYHSGRPLAIWGGTGKAAAFINQHRLDAQRFPLVVDSDPQKAGTCVPGTGQKIRFRDHLLEHPVQVILIATQWRAADIVGEIHRCGIAYQSVLLEHQGQLIDYFRDRHPYRGHARHDQFTRPMLHRVRPAALPPATPVDN